MDLNMLGAILICFSTLMIFSFLYKDNPLYKFAEHVFVGISAGYGIVMVWTQVLTPNLWDRLWIPKSVLIQRMFIAGEIGAAEYTTYDPGFADHLAYAHWVYMLFLVLGIMMLFKVTKRLHWVSRWPLAYVIGAFAGIQVIQAAQGSLIPQLQATMKDFSGRSVVEEMLLKTNDFPNTELQARRAEVQNFFALWYGEELSDLQTNWLVEQMLGDVRDSRLLEEQPRALFRKLPARIPALLKQDLEFEKLASKLQDGQPLEISLQLALSGQALENPLPLEELKQLLQNMEPRGPGNLPELNLTPWQEEFYGLMFRVEVENLQAENKLGLLLQENGLNGTQAVAAAAVLSRPPGRQHLLELYKADAFAAGTRLDWHDRRTVEVIDSLLRSSNPRPEVMWQWSSEQKDDLSRRLADAGQQTGLSGEFNLRLRALDELLLAEYNMDEDERLAVQWPVLSSWLAKLPAQAGKLRKQIISDAAALYTQSGLLGSFNEEEMRDFRRNPRDVPPLVTGLEDGSATQFARLSYSVLGVIGLDLEADNHSLWLRMFIEILSNLLVVVGVCTGVFYFFFSKKQTGGLGVVSKIGIAFLMMSFGASFGYTVMGRISLAIGRMQDLLIYPKIALVALLLIIAVLVIQSRGQEKQG